MARNKISPPAPLEPAIDQLLGSLACAWLTIALLRRLFSRASAARTPSASLEAQGAELRSLQLRYLSAWLCFKAADWMQGPYFHEVYSSKIDEATGQPLSQKAISSLFLAGFISSALVGTAAGSLVDKYGRRAGCLAFAIICAASAVSVMASRWSLLAAGRFLGGVATSLFMCAPESWLCAEHARLSLPAAALGELFGWAYFADSIIAILAGQVASYAAAVGGPTAPFLASLPLLLMGSIIVVCTWSENRAVIGGGGGGGLRDGLYALMREPTLLALAFLQALFEASMYIFVLVWGGAVASAAPTGADVPFGKIFSCLMAACAVGSALFSLLSGLKLRVEAFMQPVLLGAAIALYSAAFPPADVASLVWPLPPAWLYLIFCFIGFEVAVGVYFPAVGSMRGAYLPDSQRGAIMNITRVPLNVLVIIVALARDELGDRGALLCAAAALLLATVALATIWMRGVKTKLE